MDGVFIKCHWIKGVEDLKFRVFLPIQMEFLEWVLDKLFSIVSYESKGNTKCCIYILKVDLDNFFIWDE